MAPALIYSALNVFTGLVMAASNRGQSLSALSASARSSAFFSDSKNSRTISMECPSSGRSLINVCSSFNSSGVISPETRRPNNIHIRSSSIDFYSFLKYFTGFAVAVFIACNPTVSNAIPSAPSPASTKTHQLNAVL